MGAFGECHCFGLVIILLQLFLIDCDLFSTLIKCISLSWNVGVGIENFGKLIKELNIVELPQMHHGTLLVIYMKTFDETYYIMVYLKGKATGTIQSLIEFCDEAIRARMLLNDT